MFKELIAWSKKEFSHLPWRKRRSLYGTLVSEIMLQQTTVGTVLGHYERFLKEYPTLEDLAQASEEQITVSWKGLGYYRRARNLLAAAKELVKNFGGEIPLEEKNLLSIKGIGPYTASALLSIGSNLPALAIDANLERVLSRLFGVEEEKGPRLQKALAQLFQNKKILADIECWGARDLNEALMDLGRTFCQANRASCELCPLSRQCVAFRSGRPLEWPKTSVSKAARVKGLELHLLRVVVRKGKKILVYKKSADQWLSGQYELPTFILSSADKNLTQYPAFKGKAFKKDQAKIFKTTITKYKITNYVLEMEEVELKKWSLKEAKTYTYRELSEKENFSTSTFKALRRLNLNLS